MSRMNPREVCANCRYFNKGRCERYPPKILVRDIAGARLETRWPHVDEADYCGEFSQTLTTGNTK